MISIEQKQMHVVTNEKSGKEQLDRNYVPVVTVLAGDLGDNGSIPCLARR